MISYYLSAPLRCCLLFVVFAGTSGTSLLAADLTRAVVVVPGDASPREKKAVEMLLDEVHKRTQVKLPVENKLPAAGQTAIIVGNRDKLKQLSTGFTAQEAKGAEGYRLASAGNRVLVSGNDERGVLFGVGALLRNLHMTAGKLTLADGLDINTAPASPIRGHQLGYRPKTNSYDAWDLKQWEQYYRDLAVFGCNAVELIPPRSDDAATSPHFPLPPMEMMVGMSRVADEYGLDVWIWYPAMDKDYGDPKTVEAALAEWTEVYKKLPRIDVIFVPGGDPGHTQPKHLMALLEKQTVKLHESHPKAQMWVSPQSFNSAWLEEFYAIVRSEPEWLSGIVFGPQVRASLPVLRASIPARYPIRHYPDITHSRQCQYPVPDWDLAHAVTSAREPINPRPLDQAEIFRVLQPYTVGFITYSEGCNDDVNKFVWSGLGWDPNTPVQTILREFGQYFIGDAYGDDFAQGLLGLERNWRGLLAANEGVYDTLEQFKKMESKASPEVLGNWRFQQALYRAYYDAYVRARLLHETKWISRHSRSWPKPTSWARWPPWMRPKRFWSRPTPVWSTIGVPEPSNWLRRFLRASRCKPVWPSMARSRWIAAPRSTRSTFRWETGCGSSNGSPPCGKNRSRAERLKGLAEIVHWTDPGPGGFYDDLGRVGQQPHLLSGPDFAHDPARLQSSRVGFSGFGPMRASWKDHAEALIDWPLLMRYEKLDANASYKLRVTYGGDGADKKVRLTANNLLEIHPLITKKVPVGPVEFDIPREATLGGTLDLSWFGEQGLAGNGRNCQVSEVWLIKKTP